MPTQWHANFGYARESRIMVYRHCMDAMAMFPAYREELMLRLREDASKFSVSAVIDLLLRANKMPPTESYIAVINDLWHRCVGRSDKEEVIDFIVRARSSWVVLFPSA